MSKRLLATVAFFDVFEMPLQFEMLRKVLFGESSFNPLELEIALDEAANELEQKDGYVFLKGKAELTHKHKITLPWREKLIRKAKRKAWIFKSCPFVDFVAICNYLPLGVVEKNSDIDLLVVTRPGRIFTARLFLTMLSHLAGIRRHGEKVEGRFCLSFYLNAENLALYPLLIKPDDIYMAFWMVALLPVYEHTDIFKQVQKANELWLGKYFENLPERYYENVAASKKKNLSGAFWEFVLKGKLGDWLEKNLQSFFVKRHRRNIEELPENASVEVSSFRLKFHNNDKRLFFLEQFKERLERSHLI